MDRFGIRGNELRTPGLIEQTDEISRFDAFMRRET